MTAVRAALSGISVKPADQRPSIAVLPFANMSVDKENEYFSDGLAEGINNVLADVPGLKVIARTSAFAFRDRHEDIRRIAEGLRRVGQSVGFLLGARFSLAWVPAFIRVRCAYIGSESHRSTAYFTAIEFFDTMPQRL